MKLIPVNRTQVTEYIKKHHRHHKPPAGYKFAIGLANDLNQLVGVIVAGRPVARNLDDGSTLEITRCCVDSTTKNAVSMLYGAVVRAGKAMGYTRFITYTRLDETGESLRAAGWLPAYQTKAKSWNTPSRTRTDKTEVVERVCWSPSWLGSSNEIA